MKTKEAIETLNKFLESDLNFLGSHHVTIEEYKKLLAKRNEIIELLKRGEKYEEIYNEIYERSYRKCQIDMESVKQKYFPK